MVSTRFLEFSIGMLIATKTNIPTRPTAEIELRFVDKCVLIQVLENKTVSSRFSVARYDGSLFEICHHKYETNSSVSLYKEVWIPWKTFSSNKPLQFHDEIDAMVWIVLAMSDVGCPAQTLSDFPEARKSDFWPNLLEEIKQFHAIASIMLT